MLLKLSGCVFDDAAFNRMHGEATDEIAQTSLAIMDLKSEIKRRVQAVNRPGDFGGSSK